MKILPFLLLVLLTPLLHGSEEAARVLYKDSFTGAFSDSLHMRMPDQAAEPAPWTSIDAVKRWLADGSWTTSGAHNALNANAFLSFVPEEGKVYRLKIAAAAEGAGVFYAGFTSKDASQLAFISNEPGPCWRIHGQLSSKPGLLEVGDSGNFQSAMTLAEGTPVTLILDTRPDPWRADWRVGEDVLHSQSIRQTHPIHFVAIGAHRPASGKPGVFRISEIELSVIQL